MSTRPTLTRGKAADCLIQAGFDPKATITTNLNVVVPLVTLMIGIGEAESSLIVDAKGGPNPNGTYDYGVWQINEVHGDDLNKLLTDPYYTAQCAFTVYVKQGAKAWAAYSVKNPTSGLYPYAKFMPPGYGGATLQVGVTSKVVASVQAFLNARGAGLVEDGEFGLKTQTAVVAWKKINCDDGTGNVDARCWKRMGLL